MKKHFFLYLFVSAIFLIISSPTLFSDGMFMDGLIYSSVSRNLAQGVGSFWNLHFTNTVAPQFNGHPPLFFGIQGSLFYVFGDSIFVERFFCLFVAIISGVLIAFIWQKVNTKLQYKNAWLPLLFWISIPLVTWAYSNNVLENLMLFFLLLSIYFILFSFQKYRFLMIFFAGLSIFFALLTKGPTALFPLTTIFFYWIVLRKIKFSRMLLDSFLLFLSAIVPLSILFLFPQAKENLIQYYNEQLFTAFTDYPQEKSRFDILYRLSNELLPAIGIAALVIIVGLIKKIKFKNISTYYKEGLFFLSIALSASLPLIVTFKQRGFYLTPSLPFFALSLSFFVIPFIIKLNKSIIIKKSIKKIFQYLTLFLFGISIMLSVYFSQKIGREQEKVSDVQKIIELVPPSSDINICKQMYSDWSLHGYFARYANISLYSREEIEYQYLLTDKTCKHGLIGNYKQINIKLNRYKLYKKK